MDIPFTSTTLSPLEIVVHLANLVYLGSYSVRDILWLRVLTIVGMMMCIPYFLYQHENPMWVPVTWHIVFCIINLYHIVRLFRERLPVELTDEERSLHETTFRNLSAQQVRQILSQAEWRNAVTGQQIVEQNIDLKELILIQAGTATVQVDGATVATLEAGQFVGEISFLTEGRTTARVLAASPLRYAVWTQSIYERVVEPNPDLNVAIYSMLGVDLVRKLLATRRGGQEVAL